MKQETYKITKKDYLDFFKDSISVKRRKELEEQITNRLDFIWITVSGDNHPKIYWPEHPSDDEDGLNFADSLLLTNPFDEDEEVPVSWLWDDSWVKAVNKLNKDSNNEDLNNQKQCLKMAEDIYSYAATYWSKKQWELFTGNAGYIATKISKRYESDKLD